MIYKFKMPKIPKSRLLQSVCFLVLFIPIQARAQITVYPVQNLNFGKFSAGISGGIIEISTSGSRIATGSIILISSGSSEGQAIFDIEAPASSSITIMNGPDAILEDNNGGQLILHIDAIDPISPINFPAEPGSRVRIEVSGTLTIPPSSSPGNYQGTFYITVNNE